MIDNNQKKAILKKILESSEFVNSQKNRKLLKFLFHTSIENLIPKEFDIASEVFDRDENFDPSSDTIVRVSMHNLRIKLDHYYANEGKKERIHVVIDKGHYELKFLENCNHSKKINLFQGNKIHLPIYGILLLIILILGYFIINYRNKLDFDNTKLRSRVLWKELTHSKRTKRFVVGDEYFFIEYTGLDQTVVRKHHVNTFDDFDQYVQSQKDSLKREKTPYQYFPKMVVWPMGRIIKILPPSCKINFKASSLFTSSDMLKDDIIFIGSYRSLYLFEEIIKDLSIDYQNTPDYTNLTITNKDTSIYLSFEGEPGIKHTDFCFLRKLPGPSNNTIIMIFSGFYVGLAGVTEIITDNKKLKKLEDQIIEELGYLPQYYNILFKSFGHSRTAFKTEVIHIEAFDPDNILW